jgi:acetyl-CoA acetyltransferase
MRLPQARDMHLYGATREQLAQIAVDARAWARLNPIAFSREALTIEDVLRARPVSDPLTVRDCCLVTDGAGAVVLVRQDRAQDLSASPVAASPPKYLPFVCFAKPLTTTSRAGGDCITSMSGLVLQQARASEIVSLALCLSSPYFSEGSGGALSGERRKCVACSNE